MLKKFYDLFLYFSKPTSPTKTLMKKNFVKIVGGTKKVEKKKIIHKFYGSIVKPFNSMVLRPTVVY